METPKQSGAVEACWAHNPEVRGSKPRSAKGDDFRSFIFYFLFFLLQIASSQLVQSF